MSDRMLIQALETRLINAWPAFEIEMIEGWILRFAEGYSKRANAATPIQPGATLDADLVAHIGRSYAARGLDACFRLTGLEAPEAETVLAEAGLVAFDPSLALVAPIDPEFEVDDYVRIENAAKPRWIADAAAHYGGDKADHARLGRIVRLIRQPAAFATLEMDGNPAAWGLAVAERGYVGLYDLVVAPDLRGLGVGRRLVATLMAWEREAGATHAYLQVRETNEVALALYRSLGFETAYRYTHRVAADSTLARRPDSVATKAPAAISAQASPSASVGSA